MAKKRVHEIAKEKGIPSKEVLAILQKAGFDVKAAASSVDEDDIAAAFDPKLKTDGKKPKAETKKTDAKKPKADSEPEAKPEPEAKRPRPARTSRGGESAPSSGAGGRRRRVVIDSQASRRTPGMPPQQQAPPRRRGRRRRTPWVEPDLTAKPEPAEPEVVITPIQSGATVKEVAESLGLSAPEVIKKLMELGEMATLTQTLSDEAIEVLADGFDKKVEIQHAADEVVAEPVFDDSDDELVERPPVVTIMGHVDHGKTSLLDAIRETEVAAGEAGGITQHIGAYQVHHDDHTVTFLDTPGHEAFTAMRARGGQVADIAVVVVAADDGVMPQTVEAIDHAKAAEVPIMVAVNKIDKEGADPNRVRGELAQQDLTPADWGGDTEFVDVSAKTRQNLEELVETLITLADIQELKANPDAEASGAVIESRLDPGRGPVVSLLVQRGTLKVGDALVAGEHSGRARALHDYRGEQAQARHARNAGRGAGLRRRPRGGRARPRGGQRARGAPGGRRAREPAEDRGAGAPRRRARVTRGRDGARQGGRAGRAEPGGEGRRGGLDGGARGRDRQAAAGADHR